ncbi:MAG TPA: hypothetical protein VGH19_02355 [Verrucomicrobiae bacterium]
MDESTQKTVARIQDLIANLESQVVQKKKLVNQLYEMEGESPLYADIAEPSTFSSGSQSIRPDQFFGRPLATVVREILESRRTRNVGAISLNELFDTLKTGGFAFDNKDETIAKRNLAITISKNPVFLKVPNNGHIGLAEWYPAAKKKPVQLTGEEEADRQEILHNQAMNEENNLAAQEAAEKEEQ